MIVYGGGKDMDVNEQDGCRGTGIGSGLVRMWSVLLPYFHHCYPILTRIQ